MRGYVFERRSREFIEEKKEEQALKLLSLKSYNYYRQCLHLLSWDEFHVVILEILIQIKFLILKGKYNKVIHISEE